MTRYIGCETARTLLDAFVDGELVVDEQVTVEAHLRWCETCAARVEDAGIIGAAVGIGSPMTRSAVVDDRTMAAMQDDVLSRISAEHDQSFGVRVRAMFEDMHLLWPALGATCAVLICLAGATTVLYATNEEHPDSLAAMISTVSDRFEKNPLLLDNTVVIPRGLDDGPTLDVADDDAMFAFAAVVSTEGRIADSTLLLSQRDVARTNHDRRSHQREVDDLLRQVKQSRFEPAQALSGRKAPVNMVWLIARTTVKGSAREVDAVNAAAPAVPARKHEAVKPPVTEPIGAVSSIDSDLTTA
jgi:hypothetical protein